VAYGLADADDSLALRRLVPVRYATRSDCRANGGDVLMRGIWLFLRSAFWTIAFPGFFAGFIPWRYFGVSQVAFDWTNPLHLFAGLLIASGALLLLTCIYEFAARGRGTLSPVDPPKELVVRGLYRYVRNRMYLSVTTIVLGEALLTQSQALAVY